MIELAIYEGATKLGAIQITDSDSFPLALSKSVSDVNDISSRKGTFSKTFVVPATTNNNKILKYIYNANVTTTGYRECTILSNGMPFSKGYIRALKSSSRQSPDSYELSYVGDTADWYVRLNNKSIRDYDYGNSEVPSFTMLDGNSSGVLPALTDTSVLSKEYINASWVNQDLFDYVYPLVSYGQPVLGLQGYTEPDFRPDIYIGKMLDKAFTDIGYTLTSDFFTSGIGSKLHLSFIGDNFKQPLNYINERSFEADLSADYLAVTNQSAFTINDRVLIDTDIEDDGNIFDTATSVVTIPSNGNYVIDFSVIVNITPTQFNQVFVELQNSNAASDSFFVGVKKVGTTNSIVTASIIQGFNLTIPASGSTLQPFELTSPPVFLDAGSYELFLFMDVDFVSNTAGQFANINVSLKQGSLFSFELQPDITTNQSYNIASTLPDLKVTDILGGLLNMFNLQFTTDGNVRSINIEPKPDLYQSVNQGIDYSEKLDLSNQINDVFINGYKRNLKFSFKLDSNDKWVEKYNEENGIEYGSTTYQLTDEFEEGVTDLGTDYFAATITYDKHSWSPITGCPIPILWNDISEEPEKSYGFEPRVLYYNGLGNIPIKPVTFGNVVYPNAQWKCEMFNITTQNIPRSFMFDPSYQASDPVNILYSDGQLTNQVNDVSFGLARTYYRSDIAIIASNRVIQCYFKIVPSEFKDISLFTPIYISHHDKQGWYYINAITDFAPTRGTTTLFELVKAYDSLPIDDPITFDVPNIGIVNKGVSLGSGFVRPVTVGNTKPNKWDNVKNWQTAVLQNGSGNVGLVDGAGVVFGNGLQQTGRGQHIFGNWNYPTQSQWMVGVGISDTERYNGLQFTGDGELLVHGGNVKTIKDGLAVDLLTRKNVDGINTLTQVYLKGNNGG